MLKELRIENLVLIEGAQLRFGAGLNAITGETGAGKTVLAHAIDLLLGGKARKGVVRPGASEAYVEGVFELPRGLIERAEFADLRERIPAADGGEIALARRVSADGRTRAFVEGRSATAADLRDLGGALVRFYGQHEHRKITLGSSQLGTLDAFAGATQTARVAQARESHAEITALERRLTEVEELDGRRERELGLVEFELAEIEALAPQAEEEDELATERDRLRGVDVLRDGAATALAAIDGDESAGASELLTTAARRIAQAAAADTTLSEAAARLEAAAFEVSDVAGELRAYGEALAADPERLQIAEERLDAYERLKRKHGGSVEAVLAHAELCREQRAALSGAHELLEGLQAERNAALARQTKLCKQLTSARRKAAPRLAAAVTRELATLALADAKFEIAIEPRAGGPGASGADAVEFLIAPNPGMPLMPLSETASGGEVSRVMLALLTAAGDLAGGDAGGTYAFDEIDAGIGGHTARAVGEKLRALGECRQVICITHLPQVAALAQNHFQIEKRSEAGATSTAVRSLVADEVVDELCRMLGAESGDAGAREHVRELRAAA